MGFFKNIVKNAVSDGLSKGIRDAVSSAAEKVIAPKAEEYANSLANTLNEATKTLNGEDTPAEEPVRSGALSSLEASLNRMSQAAEKYAATMEKAAAAQEDLAKVWNEQVPDFPVWCFSCSSYWFSDQGTAADGAVYHVFNTENSTQEELDTYAAMLRQTGFVRKYPSSDDILYKDLGGEYLVFSKVEAFNAAPVMSIVMCRTADRSEIEI